jgi:oxygen-dependent protoporphyrinogen oxidase
MRVVVVGGGVAGLVTAVDLARAGVSVTALEPDHWGGCVAPVEVAGLTLDAGAESFATRTPAVQVLLGDLGLADDVVLPRRLGSWARLADRDVPLPAAGMLGIPVDPWAPDVRRAIGVVGAARAALDRLLPARVGLPDGPVSVGALVRARLGRRVLDRLVTPVVAGVHAADPDLLDLDVALPGLRAAVRAGGSLGTGVSRLRERAPAGAAAAGLRGGMHRLPAALLVAAAAAGVDLRAGTSAVALQRHEGGWRVVTTRGPGASSGGTTAAGSGTLDADHVVLATPGAAAAGLLAPVVHVDPPPQTGVTIVTLVVDAPGLDAAPRGTGVLVAPGALVGAKGLTHATAKWEWLAAATAPGRHVVRLSYGRGPMPPEVDPTTALHDAGLLLGVRLGPEHLVGAAVTRWPQGLGAPEPGHGDRLAALRDPDGRPTVPGLWVTGAWVAGTGLAAVVADARRTAAHLSGGLF